jgi:hypothetical protein
MLYRSAATLTATSTTICATYLQIGAYEFQMEKRPPACAKGAPRARSFFTIGLAPDRNRTLLFMNSGPNTYGVYISSYREPSGFFMGFASTFGQVSMIICPREHHGSRPGAFRNIRPVGGRAPAGSGTCADGVRRSDFRRVPPPAKSQPPGWHGASRSIDRSSAPGPTLHLSSSSLNFRPGALGGSSAKTTNDSVPYRSTPTCPRRSTSQRTRITIAYRSPSCWPSCKHGARRKLCRRPFR